MHKQKFNLHVMKSLSARRAWIEISSSSTPAVRSQVALRKESVDRNLTLTVPNVPIDVALRKESVDRNCVILII